MTAPRTCRLVTLGCKVNQYETQYVKETLEANGYIEAPEEQPADLCIVNTCTVTAEGDAKSRQAVRRLHQAQPHSAIVVMGCYATRDPDAVARLPGVVKVIADKTRIVEELGPFGVVAVIPGITRFDAHQRAFVKVQDGCLLNCSYCIIPHVRPSLRSRTPEEIVSEVEQLVQNGYREIVLTGIHLGHYGIDLSRGRPKSQWCRLWHLLERLVQLPGDFRIRLSSLEAAEARDDLLHVLAEQPRICPHLHLCLQSGSDRILARMKRRYRSAGFLERCRRIRTTLDRPALTTDVIIGFPGETDADFEATCRVVREAGFARLHLFSYSPRSGTVAAGWGDSVPPAVVVERRARLLRIERDLAEAYCRSLLGKRLDVLVEGVDPHRPGFVRGTACRAVTVVCRGHAPALIRRRLPVRAVAVADGVVLAEPEAVGEADEAGPPSGHRSPRRISLSLTEENPLRALDIGSGEISVEFYASPRIVEDADGAIRPSQEGRRMTRPYQYIEVERRGDAFCARLSQTHLDELKVHELAGELRRLVCEDGCRKLALSLGPQPPECLYSVFLAKLIALQRIVREHQGELVLCDVPPAVHSIFEACGLLELFYFLPDFDSAVANWEKRNHESHESRE